MRPEYYVVLYGYNGEVVPVRYLRFTEKEDAAAWGNAWTQGSIVWKKAFVKHYKNRGKL